MSKNPYIITVGAEIANKLQEALIERGFELSQPPYTYFSAKKKGLSCTLYQSGKLMVQGKETEEFVEFFLEPEILGTFSQKNVQVNGSARIGIDESGKGDLFGPLCIAGLFAEGDNVAKLQDLGVCDSKKLNDKTVERVAKKLRDNYSYHIVRINPSKYNTLYAQFRNLNRLLAWGHATTIESLVTKTGCRNIVVDQFGAKNLVLDALKSKGLELEVLQQHRAEEDLVVAGASILARDAFLHWLREKEKDYGMPIPKGASSKTVSAARLFASKYGKERLEEVTKLHFKSLDGIRP